MIRGLGSQMIHWPDALVQGFARRGYRVVIFDNRDVGLSARCPATGVTGDADEIMAEVRAGRTPQAAYTLEDMARDTTGLMDALGIGRAHVFGISMGGGIAQVLAASHAGRVITATIVMSAAAFSPEVLEAVLVRPLDRDAFVGAAVQMNRDWGSPGFPWPDAEVREIAGRAHDRGAQADGVNRQALATMASGDRRAMLPGVSVPCLVIHGTDDALIPAEAGREVAALIPGAELEVIGGMGHVITPALAPLIVGRVDRFIRGQA